MCNDRRISLIRSVEGENRSSKSHPGLLPPYVRRFATLTNKGNKDVVPLVGGKNASLGEMIGALKDESIRVPGGFATTALSSTRWPTPFGRPTTP